MQFLNPLFWTAAAALAVPILVHLFRKERKTTVPFASLMFLRRLPIKETRRRKLRYLLLFSLRCLALILIVAAFAKPVVTADWLLRANPLATRSVAILIDRSMSVSQTPAWGRALEAARAAIGAMGPEDQAILVQFGDSADVVSLWQSEKAKLLDALASRVTPSYESTDYAQGLQVAAEQLAEASNDLKQILLITDLQRSGLSSDRSWRAPAGIQVKVVDVGSPTENLFIQQVRIERNVYGPVYPNPVLVRVMVQPPAKVEGEVRLELEGALQRKAPLTTDDNGTALVTLPPFDVPEGISKGRVVIDHSDAIGADNVFQFVLERREPRTMVVLSDDPNAAGGLYLQSALSSGSNLPYVVQQRRTLGRVSLDPAESPVLILDDLRTPPPREALESYLQGGGGLLIALGSRAQSQAYNERWGDLLPAALVERHFVKNRQKTFTSMTEIAWEHPIFSVFQDIYRAAVAETQFYGYWKLTPKDDAVVIARFAEGDPALVESAVDSPGRILLFASTADPVWTDFPLRSAYVPFWQSAVQYAFSWAGTPAQGRVGQVLSLDPWDEHREKGTSGRLSIIDPQGGRVLGLDEETPDFVRLAMPGYYEVRSNKSTDWIAANVDPLESELDRMPPEDFEAAYIPPPSRSRQATQEIDRAGGKSKPGVSVWWIFLAAAATILLLESGLANRASRRQVRA